MGKLLLPEQQQGRSCRAHLISFEKSRFFEKTVQFSITDAQNREPLHSVSLCFKGAQTQGLRAFQRLNDPEARSVSGLPGQGVNTLFGYALLYK